MDIYYNNQKIYCEQNKLPMFASSSCSHMYSWIQDERYGNIQTLGEMLVERHGEQRAFQISASTHITGCPVCSRAWDD